MKKINSLIFILILFLGLSCSKDDELALSDVYSSVPVFTFSANNNAYSIEAGVADFYMFTDYERDSSNVFSFISRFSTLSDCVENCSEELLIKIRDTAPLDNVDSLEISAAITTGSYNFGLAADLDFSVVAIQYTDREGNTYRSDILDQNGEGLFEVLDIQDYDINENGDPTKKLEINFNCILQNPENGEIIAFNNAHGFIGIAYPR